MSEKPDPEATAARAPRVLERMCQTPHGPKRSLLAAQHVTLSNRVHYERGYLDALAQVASKDIPA